MKVIRARNVNDAWFACKMVVNSGVMVARSSRVGDVLEYPEPVCTVYDCPLERVLFDPLRNCNPYFHFAESLWLLAGRNDIGFLTQFNPRMKEFSDDGLTQRGAYGYRWRNWFVMEREKPIDVDTSEDNSDQLNRIVRMLKKNPDERRAVLSMWDANEDLEMPRAKDIPCNLSVMFKIRQGCLTATISCRSNDNCWGTYGANPVQFSYLLEYMAARIGVPVGHMYQISDSWHVYRERWEQYGGLDATPVWDPYVKWADDSGSTVTTTIDGKLVEPYQMVTHPESFDAELQDWFVWAVTSYSDYAPKPRNEFFYRVAAPLLASWRCYKANDLLAAHGYARICEATDWSLAATQWLDRIEAKRREKNSCFGGCK